MLHATDPSLFSQVPWETAGIAASLLIATVVVAELFWNYRTFRRKAQQRDILNGFRGDGHELLERCEETTVDEATADGWTLPTETNEWAVKTEAYLQEGS